MEDEPVEQPPEPVKQPEPDPTIRIMLISMALLVVRAMTDKLNDSLLEAQGVPKVPNK